MAEFNPQIPDPSNPDRDKGYMGYSEGFRPAPVQNAPPAKQFSKHVDQSGEIKARSDSEFNRSMGQLFGQAVVATDYVAQSYIENALTDQTNAIRDEYGVGAMALQNTDGSSLIDPTPPQLDIARKNLETLGASYASGRMQESQYWARLESMTRQMKTRFPGYRGEIDSMVSKLTGATPANVVRELIQREAVKAGESATDTRDKLLKHGRENGWLYDAYPNFDTMEAEGRAPSTMTLQAAQGQRSAVKYQLETERLGIAAAKDRGEQTEQSLISLASRENYQLFTSKLNRDIGTQGLNLQETIDQYVNLAKSGETVPTKDVQQLYVQFKQFRQEVEKDMAMNLATKYSGQDGLMIEGEANMNSTKQQVKELMDSMESAFNNKDWSLLAHNLQQVEGQTDERVAQLVKEHPEALNDAVIRKLYGDAAVSSMYMLKQGNLSKTMDILNKFSTQRIVTGKSDFTTELHMIAGKKGSVATDSEVFNLVDRNLSFITNKDMTPEQRAEAAKKVFAPDNRSFVGKLTESARLGVWRRFTAPEIQQAMLELKNTGADPLAWNRYQTWVEEGAGAVVQKHVSNVRAIQMDEQKFDIAYDEKTNKLQVVFNKEGMKGFERATPILENVRRGHQAEVDLFNEVFAGLAPVLQEGGKSPEEAMRRFIEKSGVNLEEPKAGTIAAQIYEALGFGGEPEGSPNDQAPFPRMSWEE